MKLEENEVIEDLQFKNLKIIQNKKWFCFGMDSVLLSNFVKGIKNNDTILDLGAGTGIISVLLSGKTSAKKIISVEKQEVMAELIKKNIQLNAIKNKVELINDDIINLENYIEKNSIDVIVTNPPYKNPETGLTNDNEQKYISKFETTANLEKFIEVAHKLLKEKGKFFIVYRPDRLVDLFSLMRRYKIEPKRMQLVYSHSEKEENAKLVLVEGVKLGKAFLKIEDSIFVYNKNGEYTKQLKQIYGKVEKE